MDERKTKMYFVALDELNKPLTTRVEELTKREKEKINELSVKWVGKEDELTTQFNKVVCDGLLDKSDSYEKQRIYKNQISHESPKEVTRKFIEEEI